MVFSFLSVVSSELFTAWQPSARVELLSLYSLSHFRNSSYSSLMDPSKIMGFGVSIVDGGLDSEVVVIDGVELVTTGLDDEVIAPG